MVALVAALHTDAEMAGTAGQCSTAGAEWPWCAAEAMAAADVVGTVTAAEGPGDIRGHNGRSACLCISPVRSALMADDMPFALVFCHQGRKKGAF